MIPLPHRSYRPENYYFFHLCCLEYLLFPIRVRELFEPLVFGEKVMVFIIFIGIFLKYHSVSTAR